jgi:hypothetical protein
LKYPALFAEADNASIRFQALHWRLFRTQLILLGLAAVLGNFTLGDKPDWSGVGLLVCFFGSLTGRVWQLASSPERRWYQSRAAAESLKTLAWRFAMRVPPFDGVEADVRYSERLQEVVKESGAVLSPVVGPAAERAITKEMIALSSSSLAERALAYRSGRIEDQADWYRRKSALLSTRSRRIDAVVIGLQALGVIFGVLRATSTLSIDAVGLFGAAAGSLVGWQQARSFETLSTAYGVAARELEAIHLRVPSASTDELSWSRFVADAEEAISREHTLWRASRS